MLGLKRVILYVDYSAFGGNILSEMENQIEENMEIKWKGDIEGAKARQSRHTTEH